MKLVLTVPFGMHPENFVPHFPHFDFQVFFFLRWLILWYPVMFFPHPTATELPASGIRLRDFSEGSDSFGGFFFCLRWIWGNPRKDGPAVTNLHVKWEQLQSTLSKFNPTNIAPDQQNRKQNTQFSHPLPHLICQKYYFVEAGHLLFCSWRALMTVGAPRTRHSTTEILNNATSLTKSEGHRSEKREKAYLEKSKATTEDNDSYGAT